MPGQVSTSLVSLQSIGRTIPLQTALAEGQNFHLSLNQTMETKPFSTGHWTKIIYSLHDTNFLTKSKLHGLGQANLFFPLKITESDAQ